MTKPPEPQISVGFLICKGLDKHRLLIGRYLFGISPKVRKFLGVDGRETKTHSTNDAKVNLGDLRQAIEQQMSVPKATSDWVSLDVDGLLVPNV